MGFASSVTNRPWTKEALRPPILYWRPRKNSNPGSVPGTKYFKEELENMCVYGGGGGVGGGVESYPSVVYLYDSFLNFLIKLFLIFIEHLLSVEIIGFYR